MPPAIAGMGNKQPRSSRSWEPARRYRTEYEQAAQASSRERGLVDELPVLLGAALFADTSQQQGPPANRTPGH